VLFATGGWMSLGSLVGFVTLFGITLRNSIMLVSHYQHLVEVDGLPWGLDTALRGAAERLPSIPDDRVGDGAGAAAARARIRGTRAGDRGSDGHDHRRRIDHSTVLNLLILPTLLLHFGRFEKRVPN